MRSPTIFAAKGKSSARNGIRAGKAHIFVMPAGFVIVRTKPMIAVN